MGAVKNVVPEVEQMPGQGVSSCQKSHHAVGPGRGMTIGADPHADPASGTDFAPPMVTLDHHDLTLKYLAKIMISEGSSPEEKDEPYQQAKRE